MKSYRQSSFMTPSFDYLFPLKTVNDIEQKKHQEIKRQEELNKPPPVIPDTDEYTIKISNMSRGLFTKMKEQQKNTFQHTEINPLRDIKNNIDNKVEEKIKKNRKILDKVGKGRIPNKQEILEKYKDYIPPEDKPKKPAQKLYENIVKIKPEKTKVPKFVKENYYKKKELKHKLDELEDNYDRNPQVNEMFQHPMKINQPMRAIPKNILSVIENM